MGALQASAVSAVLLNFPTRTRLAHLINGVKLDTLGLLSALLVPRMDWNLPKRHWLFVFLVIGFGHGPVALWASAITPLPTTHSAPRGSMMVPSFSEASKDNWDQFGDSQIFNMSYCTINRIPQTPSSFVTNCPAPYRQNALINTARGATAPDIYPRNHSKLDNPVWVYQGRSYGAGSSVGLSSPKDIPTDLQLSNYSFEEIGYHASVQCHHISHPTNLTLEYQTSSGPVGIFWLFGTLPNMERTSQFPILSWCGYMTREVCVQPEKGAIFT